MSEDVRTEKLDATLIISINRPERRNAVNESVARGIAAAIDWLDSEPELLVGILTGVGGYFSSGMDLQGFLDGESCEVEGRGFGGLTEAPPRKPLIAAVEGLALAGGFEMALACDLIVAAEGAKFALPEVKRGLIAGSGGLIRLPRKIPPAIALEHALTGDPLDASKAERWGLVNRVVPRGEALNHAKALALRIASNAPLAVCAAKKLTLEAMTDSTPQILVRQREILSGILSSEDAREGASAFRERRDPKWRGR